LSALRSPDQARENFQFSAPIRPGNSGGAIIFENGSLAGIAVAGYDPVETFDSKGFTASAICSPPAEAPQCALSRTGHDIRHLAPSILGHFSATAARVRCGDDGPLLVAAEQKKSRLGLLPGRPWIALVSDNRRVTRPAV
jgi:hypothetical protein